MSPPFCALTNGVIAGSGWNQLGTGRRNGERHDRGIGVSRWEVVWEVVSGVDMARDIICDDI